MLWRDCALHSLYCNRVIRQRRSIAMLARTTPPSAPLGGLLPSHRSPVISSRATPSPSTAGRTSLYATPASASRTAARPVRFASQSATPQVSRCNPTASTTTRKSAKTDTTLSFFPPQPTIYPRRATVTTWCSWPRPAFRKIRQSSAKESNRNSVPSLHPPYCPSTFTTRISGYAPSQSGLTASKINRKSCLSPASTAQPTPAQHRLRGFACG